MARHPFFVTTPEPGKPLNVPGIATGLKDLDFALANMRGLGIDVQWVEGGRVPLLIAHDAFSRRGPTWFTARVNAGKVEFYMHYQGSDWAVYYNGTGLGHEGAPDIGWNELGNLTSATYYLCIVTISPGTTDYTDPANLMAWKISDDPQAAYNARLAFPLFTTTAGSPVIEQHREGACFIWLYDGDSTVTDEVTAAGETPAYPQRSISRTNGAQGGLQISRFANPQDPDDEDDRDDFRFLIREVVKENATDVPQVRYWNYADLLAAIEEDIDLPESTVPGEGNEGWNNWWEGRYDALARHGTLPDIVDQTVGDDHRGGRTAAAEVELDVTGHPYIHCNGDRKRNACTDTMQIGDIDDKASLAPGLRLGYADDGATESLDWHDQQNHITVADLQTEDPMDMVDDTGGTPTTPIELVASASFADCNDNFSSLLVVISRMVYDAIEMQAAITALRDALQAYKIIAEPPPPP